MPLGSKPVIAHVIDRLTLCSKIKNTIIATSDGKIDDKLYDFCMQNHYKVFRGSESDVLERYYFAAKLYKADIIIRVTGDCPLVDPEVVDGLIDFHLKNKFEAASLQENFGWIRL